MDVHPTHLMQNWYFFVSVLTQHQKLSVPFKIYLVTGGRDSYGELDSTEIFIGDNWQESGKLPFKLYDHVGTSLDNRVYMLGIFF